MRHLTRPLAHLALAAVCASVCATAAQADVIFVPADAPTIQAGIDLTLPGDIVVVGDGIWTGLGNRDITLPPFDLIVRSENGPRRCIIDSQGTVGEPHRAFYIDGPHTRATEIRGFTLTGGETETGAVQDRFNAGGILIRRGDVTIAKCRFIDNHCACWGGAICVSDAQSPRITRCFFENNSSGDEGGAFFSWGPGTTVIDNSVFIGNHAGNAGGAIFSFSPLNLDHLTIVNNDAVSYGGGVAAGGTTITNSIIWGNTAPSQPGLSSWSIAVSYSNVQDGAPGIGNIESDPRFGRNGWRLRYHASPCVDAGDPSAVVVSTDMDFEGDRRKFGRRVDMGADEAYIRDRQPQ